MLFITPAVATAIITFCGLSSAKYIITKDCTEPVDYSQYWRMLFLMGPQDPCDLETDCLNRQKDQGPFRDSL